MKSGFLLGMLAFLLFIGMDSARSQDGWLERRERRRERLKKWRESQGGGGGRRQAAGTFPARIAGPGNYEQTLYHDGIRRRYLVHIPPSYEAGAKMPVLLAFHGGGGNAEHTLRAEGIDESSDRNGFIAVFPEGTGRRLGARHLGTWNTWGCCGTALEENVDDVGFVSALLQDLAGKLSIDRKRVYATGISNGGLMSYRLACELSHEIAAVAPIAAPGVVGACAPKRPVPMIVFHGREDPCALYEGGEPCGGCFGRIVTNSFGKRAGRRIKDAMSCAPIPRIVEGWAKRNGVEQEESRGKPTPTSECVAYGKGRKGETVLCAVAGMGHVWPGSGEPLACREDPGSARCRNMTEAVGPSNSDFPANQVMWDFFRRHSL